MSYVAYGKNYCLLLQIAVIEDFTSLGLSLNGTSKTIEYLIKICKSKFTSGRAPGTWHAQGAESVCSTTKKW